MKTKNILILLFNSLFLLSCVSNTATIPQRNRIILPAILPTLHAVILADINDNKIGKSTKVDFKHINNLVQDIAINTGMVLAKHSVIGSDLNNQNVRTIINNLPVRRNDTVIFYYAGHGKNPQTGTQWPSMILNDENLELNFVVSKLKQKNPRFFLAIADTCNDFPDSNIFPPTDRGTPSKSNYQNLFLKTRGYIVASGAEPGQLSWSDSKSGGLFTNQFLNSLKRQLSSFRPANWHTIMKYATATFKLPENVIQQPQYKIEIR
ncbi:caspase family protein [Candidatus Marithrix sp. Canyon 246]|uniref:caspase family protein n=1 Tax=Candidatus Marithrix sp. Canyon 246 TaxID=1827136 RepID=UPI000849F938|nr:caspase family protein [Candidatus Marithrix sp. Canyon 246]